MATDVLRNFVVSLGARVDQNSFRAFNDSIGRTSKLVTGLAVAVEGAFLGINAWAAKTATSFDQLFFASQRIGASAANIKALSYGLSQMGSTANAANASMENFARTLRNNRGYYAVLDRLGIQTRGADGMRRDATELMREFGKALRSRSSEQQHLYLEMFGIDDATGRALIQGVDKFAEEYQEKLRKAGLDPAKAARDGNALQSVFRSIGASIEILGAKVASRLYEGQNNAFQKFLNFIDENGDKIADVIGRLAEVALELITALLKIATSEDAKKAFNAILSAFGSVDEKTGKFTADIDKLKIALGLFAGYVAGTWLQKILGAFGLLSVGFGGILKKFGIPAVIGGVALGGDRATAEQYRDSLANDPDAKAFDDARKGQRESVRGYFGDLFKPKAGDKRSFMQRLLPKSLGGQDASDAASVTAKYPDGLAEGVMQTAKDLGVDPVDVGTAVSYETGGTFDKWKRGPTTKWGTHRDLIQWGEPQAKRYGVTADMTAGQQMQKVTEYLRDAGVKPGMGLLDIYSAINAGRVGLYDRSDAAAGGAPGTVRDKVENQMGAHRRKAREMLSNALQSAKKPLTMDDILPGGLSGAAGGGLRGLKMPEPAAPNVSNSRNVTVNVSQAPINVQGINDGQRVADRIDRVQGYRTSDLVCNLRSSVA